jgi:hypothetical protein
VDVARVGRLKAARVVAHGLEQRKGDKRGGEEVSTRVSALMIIEYAVELNPIAPSPLFHSLLTVVLSTELTTAGGLGAAMAWAMPRDWESRAGAVSPPLSMPSDFFCESAPAWAVRVFQKEKRGEGRREKRRWLQSRHSGSKSGFGVERGGRKGETDGDAEKDGREWKHSHVDAPLPSFLLQLLTGSGLDVQSLAVVGASRAHLPLVVLLLSHCCRGRHGEA